MRKTKAPYIFTGIAIIAISTASIAYYLKSKKTEVVTNVKHHENKLSITSPVPSMDISFEEYTIDPGSETTIERNTGTQLKIPVSCFKRSDGSMPTEKIKLHVREFHDPITIAQAGIPMEVEGSGGKYLESAGMIEMHAYENGNELNVSQDKSIGVELAGYRASDGYSLYYLENNQAWKVTDTFENKENKRKKNQLAKLNTPTPMPDTVLHSEFTFTIDVNADEFPELKPFINQSWMLAENIDEQKLQRALRSTWNVASIAMTNKRKMEYRITFNFNRKGYGEDAIEQKESFSILATPAFGDGMSKKEQRREMERKMEEYANLEKQRIEELDRVKKQADLVNAFNVNQMGVYNIDKILKEELIITNVKFDFESELNGSKTEHKVFMILEDNNSVIPINRDQWSAMSIPFNKKFHFLAVLPNNRIAYVSVSQIKDKLNQNRKEITLSSERKTADEYFNATKQAQITGN